MNLINDSFVCNVISDETDYIYCGSQKKTIYESTSYKKVEKWKFERQRYINLVYTIYFMYQPKTMSRSGC